MRARSHQRRARQCLLAVAGTLALSPIAGTLLLDRCPIRARFPEASAIVERWQSRVPAPEIVFFGSSRTGLAVDEHQIEGVMKRHLPGSPPVFNAAIGWGDPLTMRYLATHIFSAGPPPRLVILEVTPQSVARRHPFLDIVITRQFSAADIVATGGELFHSTNKAISRLLSSRLTPFYRHRDQLLAWAGEATARLRGDARRDRASARQPSAGGQLAPPRGADPQAIPRPPQVEMEAYLESTRRLLADYEVAGRAAEALEKLAASCRKENVPVILLQAPLHPRMRALLGPEKMGKYRAFIERLERDYGCRYVDISDRIPTSMFYDSEHANGEGREHFSRVLAEEILVPLWRAEVR